MLNVDEIETAIRGLAEARAWVEVERVGKLALDLATDQRERDFASRTREDHVALAERDVREVAEGELETRDLQVLPSGDPLVETIAIGVRDGFVGLVAGCGDSHAHHGQAAAIGYRRVRQRDYLPMIFITKEEQARALLEAIVRAWPHL